MKKSTRRTQPTKDRKPVIAGRVSAALHEQIKLAAKQSGRTMSDELAWRAAISFEWESTFGDIRKLKAEASAALKGDLREAMRKDGMIRVHGVNGDYWMEPGTPPLKVALNPELERVIVDAVRQALVPFTPKKEADQ